MLKFVQFACLAIGLSIGCIGSVAAQSATPSPAMIEQFQKLPRAEQERVRERMVQWSRLPAQTRGEARLRFQQSRQLPPDERQRKWEAYQSLPAETREALSRRAQRQAQPVELPRDMAGPREALLHALFRQNYGCSHLIVGRDHAGVGSYYGPFDAQKIFDEIPAGSLETQNMNIDWTFWCNKCGGMASQRTCPHTKDDRILLSGTKVRSMLSEGQDLPVEFSRPEVAKVLQKYYAGLSAEENVKVELKGHSAK